MAERRDGEILPSEYASIVTLVVLCVWSLFHAVNADTSPWLAIDLALSVALGGAATWYWNWLHRG